jgi:hypothetical protein
VQTSGSSKVGMRNVTQGSGVLTKADKTVIAQETNQDWFNLPKPEKWLKISQNLIFENIQPERVLPVNQGS